MRRALIRFLRVQMRKANWITIEPIAHRGLHHAGEIPENSLLAFEKAIEANFPIEFDVQLTKDKQLIVFHDDDLLRLTGREGLVSNFTWAEIKDLSLFGTQQKIPLLSEVLEFVRGRVPLLIELKSLKQYGVMEPLVMELLGTYEGDFAIQSFNPKTVYWFKKNAPEVRRGYLSGPMDDEDLTPPTRFFLSNLGPLPVIQPDFIGYDKKGLNHKIIHLIKNYSHIPVIAWTIKAREEEEEALQLADNIIFEGFQPFHGRR